jgi:hypothetical protein
MLHAGETRTEAGGFVVPWPSVVAMVLAPMGIVIASLAIPTGVDRLPTSDDRARDVPARVAAHPFERRVSA